MPSGKSYTDEERKARHLKRFGNLKDFPKKRKRKRQITDGGYMYIR